MALNLLKVAPSNMAFTKVCAECISIFGARSKKAVKTIVSTNVIKHHSDKGGQVVKSANQICKDKKKEKIEAQTEKIEQQKEEIENLKAASMQMDPKKLIEPMTQAMACMYNTTKDPSKKMSGKKPIGGKPYLGNTKQPQITKGLDGTTDPNLICKYCKDSGHGLDNCKKLQQKIQREQLAAKSIIAEMVLNKKHP